MLWHPKGAVGSMLMKGECWGWESEADWRYLSVFFSQCLQNPSSDIRLVAEKMIWWANKDPLPPLEPQAIKPILKALLDNTKDKNTVVRAYSDQAIINLLKMRQGEELFQVGAWAWSALQGMLWTFVLLLFCTLVYKHHSLLCCHICVSCHEQIETQVTGLVSENTMPEVFRLLQSAEPFKRKLP
jgi:hypothetical protein